MWRSWLGVGAVQSDSELSNMSDFGGPDGSPVVFSRADLSQVFSHYKRKLRRETEDLIAADVRKQIELDVPRTFNRALTEEDQENMRIVLLCYALYNPELGYCQSMNVLVAVMLFTGLEDHECFTFLVQLLAGDRPGTMQPGSCGLLAGYHAASMAILVTDMKVLEHLMEEFTPKVLQELRIAGLDVLFFAVDPFMCMFGHTLPLPVLVRVWDVLILEGNVALFAVFIALLALTYPHQQQQQHDSAPTSPQELVSKWQRAIRRLAVMDINTVLVKTRAYLDTGAITREKIELLRRQAELRA